MMYVKRHSMLRVRMNDAEREMLRELAKLNGRTQSDFVRALVLSAYTMKFGAHAAAQLQAKK